MKYIYKTQMVCAKKIEFDIEKDKIKNIKFYGGCNGNLKAIAKLVDDWKVDKIEQYLKGNTCGNKKTSCADQLAKAAREAYEVLKQQSN